MVKKNNIPELFKLILFVTITVVFTYFMPRVLSIGWYIILLFLYYRSSDEAFWLVLFLITTDGFLNFMGLYEVTLPLFPGLPEIELVQFYVILSVIKASRKKVAPHIFFNKFLIIIGLYIVFMVIWGQAMGFSQGLNGYFRLAKILLPLLLFYSIPRHFMSIDSYRRLFALLFFLLLTAFLTQLGALFFGQTLAGLLEIKIDRNIDPGEFRAFYNGAIILMGFFGALFFLVYDQKGAKSVFIHYAIIFSSLSMVIMSATRGWMIAFFIVVFMVFLFSGLKIKRLAGFLIITAVLTYFGVSNSKIQKQVIFSKERLESLESIIEGDISAKGTLKRLDVRSPRVIGAWKENPIFGWGFSDYSRRYSDGHVANQTLLMKSGILGTFLLISFLIYFSFRMVCRYISLHKKHPIKPALLVFVFFLLGWFFIHSTSGQQFNYGGLPLQIIPQVVFFSFASFIYNETFRKTSILSENN